LRTIALTSADNERVVEACPGDEIAVLLAENATTGYRWYLDRADESIVLVSDGYQSAGQTGGGEVQFGRGGIREYRFRVTAPGTSQVALKHWQEWEGERSVRERFTVTVRALTEND
jgi:inhibitor of cysteine peptidase